MKGIIASFGAVLLASSAWAGVSIKSNAVPVVDECDAGNCELNDVACATNADCSFGSLSLKSKASLGADGRFKLQLKGIVDEAGVEAAGDYMLDFDVATTETTNSGVVRVAVDGGSAKVDIDLSAFMGGPGSTTSIVEASLRTPPPVPLDCPGSGNTAAEVTERAYDDDCYSGNSIGTIGVGAMTKTATKAFVVPIVDTCDGSCVRNGTACTTNADCKFGSLSVKSKASLTGAGRLQVQLKDVVDAAEVDASGDYMLRIVLQQLPSRAMVDGVVKVAVDGGKGKADVDLSSLFTPAGTTMNLFSSQLYTPPAMPEDCPGTGNTAAEVLARASDYDCFSSSVIGTIGIVAE